MEKVDILIKSLQPEIDSKCAEIRQKKSDKLLTKVFMISALLMLIFPAVLISFGVSMMTVLIPFIFIGVVFLVSSPFLVIGNQ